MNFCSKCNYELDNNYKYCPLCGEKIILNDVTEIEESYERKPYFVFIYEMLPSSFSTWYMLVLLFIVCYILSNQAIMEPRYVILLFASLFILKDIKLLIRKFKYRGVKYNVTNLGIEYINDSKNQQFFLPYEDICKVYMKTNLATYLFGYGHILVKGKENGIYLDYISEVDKVYEYIMEHLNH